MGAAAATTGLIAAGGARAAGDEAPITVAIDQSPWFEGFRRTVDAYQKETGNKISLEVFPSPARRRSSAARSALRRGSMISADEREDDRGDVFRRISDADP